MSVQFRSFFRKMQKEDIEQIMAVEKLSFNSPWSRAAFEGELINQFARYHVLILNQQIIGYGGMWIIIDEAHVTNVAIHPQFRGKGYGRRLMERLMADAIYCNAQRMTLEVRRSNLVAQSLYESLGFKQTGIRKHYYSDNLEDALIMWIELPGNKSR